MSSENGKQTELTKWLKKYLLDKQGDGRKTGNEKVFQDEKRIKCIVFSGLVWPDDKSGKFGELKELIEQSDEVDTLRFEKVRFLEGNDYKLLGCFEDVKNVEFVSCQAIMSEGSPKNSTSGKMADSLCKIVNVTIEGNKALYLQNILQFDKNDNLKKITVRRVEFLTWGANPQNSKLNTLEIDTTPVSKNFIDQIFNYCKDLKTLKLIDTRSKVDVEDFFEGLESQHINELRIKKTFSNKPDITISIPSGLEKLELSNMNIHNLAFENDNKAKLTELNIDHNPIDKLPEFDLEDVSVLSIADTRIEVVDKEIKELKFLNRSMCKQINWDMQEEKDSKEKAKKLFANLEWLDLSYSSLENLPSWVKDKGSLPELRYVNLSSTKIKELPELTKKLEHLVAENLFLDSFPPEILESGEWEIHTDKSCPAEILEYKNWEENDPCVDGVSEKKHAWIKGTKIRTLSPHFITDRDPDSETDSKTDSDPNRSELRRKLYESYKDSFERHQATVIFIGNSNLKRHAIRTLFEVEQEDFIDCNGMRILNVRPHLQVFNEKFISDEPVEQEAIARDANINVWTLSSQPQYRSAHDLFTPANVLYVVCLNTAIPLKLQRDAEAWYRFVRYGVKNADILFLIEKEPDSGSEVLGIDKFNTDPLFYVHDRIICLSSDRDSYKGLDEARGILTHAIRRLSSYSGNIIPGWKNTINDISFSFQNHMKMSHVRAEEMFLSDNKGASPEMFTIFRKLLVEAGICIDNGTDTLYGQAGFARFVYATLDYAKKNYGEVSLKGLYAHFLDNVPEFTYFYEDVKEILEMLSGHASSKKSKGIGRLCYEIKDPVNRGGSDNSFYYFPQFGFMREKVECRRKGNSQSEINKDAVDHRKHWEAIMDNVRVNPRANHYYIDTPLLTDAMLVDVICRLVNILQKFPEEKESGNGKHKVESVEFSSDYGSFKAESVGFNSGSEGLLAIITLPNKQKYHLFFGGVPLSPGQMLVFVAPESEDKGGRQKQGNELFEDLREVCNLAFLGLYGAFADNNTLLHRMRTTLYLPNNNLDATVKELDWRISLREIVVRHRAGLSNYNYNEWSFPMEKLIQFVPESYEKKLNELMRF